MRELFPETLGPSCYSNLHDLGRGFLTTRHRR